MTEVKCDRSKSRNRTDLDRVTSYRSRSSAAIRTLTDVNINKLYQPWRSFAAISNKCLTGKSSGYDSLRLSQAQILWGLYHKRNVDYAYLMWKDFVYQVEHKNQKKSNEMYYPRFTNSPLHVKGSFDSQEKQGELALCQGWPYVLHNQAGIQTPEHVTVRCSAAHRAANDEIRNSKAYKEYYAIATGKSAPKPKASVRRTRSSSDTSITPPTVAASPRLTAYAKGKQTAKASKAKSADEGTGSKAGVPNVPTDESKEELSWNSIDDEGDDNEEKDDDGDEEDGGDDGEEGNGNDDDDEDDDGVEGDDGDADQEVVRDDEKDDEEEGRDDEHEFDEDESDEETRDEESFDPIPQTPKNSKDEGDDIGEEERHVEEEEEDELYKDVNINQGRGIQANLEVEDYHVTLTPVNPDGMESIFETTSQLDAVNEQLKAEVLTRLSHSSRTSYAVDADLSEMELKKILIEKMEGNKSIQRSNEQRNLYKALVEAYEPDKIILDTYGETVTLKRRRDDDADKDEEPFVGPDRGSKRRREGKEPELASAPTKTATKSAGSELAKQADTRSSFNELMDTPLDFSNFLINRLKVDTLTPELLAGPTYELMKGSSKSLIELEYHLEEVFKATTDQLDWVNPEGQPRRSTISTQSAQASTIDTKQPRHQQFYGFAVNRESARDVYSKRRIIVVTELKIVEWHSYKHLDWITVQRDDDKLYKFKEGDFKRLRIQDIEDMLLLLVQGKLTNLTVEERFAFNVSHQMFIRSIVIQRRMEDLQLGVKSYHKKLNLTNLDLYRSDLKRKEAYTAYSNLRGFIYQNKDKRNRLMRINELHKFNNETLIDVRTTLDDRLKGIRMQYLPQSIWRKSDKDRAVAMIQAIDKRLKTRRIMRSLERFVGGRLYEGDFRMLQRTI
nr:hypothetical protein [Tanacetum cinerariifolium]